MRGLRRVSRPSRGRRFKGTEDPKARAEVKAERCLISGKRTTERKWQGVYPDTKLVTFEVVHVCWGPIDPHHSIKQSHGGHDDLCVPLCRAAHDEAHQLTNAQFKARWGVNLLMEGRKRAKARRGTG